MSGHPEWCAACRALSVGDCGGHVECFGAGMVPHKCPVCNGTGLVSTPPGVAGDQPEFSSWSPGPWTCRVCLGSGVLWR